MTDTIIKGSGNSHMIKTVPNIKEQVHDLDGLLDLLIRGFPVDFGPPNPAGCEVIGDNLNKDTFLKDSTAALYGEDSTATPDKIFSDIKPLIQEAKNSVLVASGTYVGTGALNKKIYIGFRAKYFFAMPLERTGQGGSGSDAYRYEFGLDGRINTVSGVSGYSPSYSFSSGSITATEVITNLNVEGITFAYIAIG